MKKFLLFTCLLVWAFTSEAQLNDANEKSAASQLLNANKDNLGLTPDQFKNLTILTSYPIQNSDLRMTYVQQTYLGIPVFNKILSLVFRKGQVVSNEGGILQSIEVKTSTNSGIPSVPAPEAVRTALTDRKVNFSGIPSVISQKEAKLDFGKMGTLENITSELMWLPTEDESSVNLVWQIFISPLNSSDVWYVYVDASANQVVKTFNLTIYCDWSNPGHSIEDHNNEHKGSIDGHSIKNFVLRQVPKTYQWQYRPFVENSGNYRVVKYPSESPAHPGGTHQLHLNPWTWAPGNATTLKWHSDGTNDFTDTRGNNVLAAEDADGNNTPGLLAVSSTALPDLTFDFVPDFTLHPNTSPNQSFYITNLFYWNNLIHDITYLYGYDEPAGNFQVNNLGRGGLGNDRVNADAQNPGNCNANFSTPVDGSSPRMQMFLCTNVSPPRDGDADNAVIMHEYGHGISNRFTGGPTVVTCLGNTEQMGEGWSDFFGLIFTQDWSTATPADGFNNPRGIGTYLFGQAPNGPGIRPTRYSTNFAVNPTTYSNLPGQAVPHGVGYVWCTFLWEMTWEIIQSAGINPNLFNPAGGGGNAIALKLVQEGMRIQSCSPGFVQGRNAILRADTLFFGGQYSCAIWRAFARRGLGVSASQGLPTSITDGVANFDNPLNFILNENITAVPEGSNITFTNRINPPCAPITNYIVRDTLPASVTYVSSTGGTLAANVVTFAPVTVAQGGSQSYSVTVNVNAGTLFVPTTFLNDAAVTLPTNWGTTVAPNDWTVSLVRSHSAPSSFFVSNPTGTSDKILTSNGDFALNPLTSSVTFLSFWHFYNTQGNGDGGVVEVSTNGGATWLDAGFRATENGYNSILGTGSALAGRRAFSGLSSGWVQTKINLSAFAGQSIKIRFRFSSNTSVPGEGWYIDDILLENKPQVYVRSGIYNSTNVLIAVADTLADIISGICIPPVITAHPLSVVRCSTPGNAVFSATATGTFQTSQWQVSSNGGVLWTDIPGATSPTYTIVNPTSVLNGNFYRIIFTATCGADTSDVAVIHVSSPLVHSAVSATPVSACAPGATDITGTVSGGTTANAVVGSSGIINLAIPDSPTPAVTSSIALPALSIPTANNLKLRLNIRHSWVGDLRVSLTSPCGTSFVFDRPGVPASGNGNSDNLGTNSTSTPPPGVYIFDLAGATVIPETTGGAGFITPGTFQPSGTTGASHTWAGTTFPCSAAGNWVLSISDHAGGDLGMLVE